MWEAFDRYCCLYREFSVFSELTPEIVMNLLSTKCYNPLYSMQFANDSMREVELKRRKDEFLLWFYRNTTLHNFSECRAVVEPVRQDIRGSAACSKSTEGIFMMYTGLWILLLVMILFNNFLIIISIFKVQHLRSNVANLFIVSLSVSDLFVGISVIPIKIGIFSSNDVFCYSRNVCRVYLMSDAAAFITSILNLVVIAIDRHLALNYPYKYPNWMTRRRAKLTIAFIWLYGFCWSTLVNVKLDNINKDAFVIEGTVCRMNHNYILVYILYAVHFLFPVISMGIIYFRILRITKNHARNISESIILNNNNVFKEENNNNNNNSDKDSKNENNTVSPTTLVPMKVIKSDASQENESYNEHYTIENKHSDKAMADLYKQSKSSLRRSSSKSMDQYRRIIRKAAQTVATVYGTFVFCWLPMAIFSIILMVCEKCAKGIPPTLYIVMIHFLPLVNSMMNAFLYAIMNSQFRRGFKIVLGVDKIRAYFKLVFNVSSNR